MGNDETKRLRYMLDLEREKKEKLKEKINKIELVVDFLLIKSKEGYDSADCDDYRGLNYYKGQMEVLNEIKEFIEELKVEDVTR